jgi:tRNA-specific 2-thiouridylase
MFFPNRNKEKLKIAVGLSGGVDSAVTAYLLNDQGHDVTGVYLQCWDFSVPGCTGDSNRADATKIAATLGIKFHHLDFIEPYKREVINYFYKSYEAGLTPNPDILCNTVIKFGLFLDWALQEGFDYVAMGHYARLLPREDKIALYSGLDTSKDQSYFLYRLNQHQLSHALFPLGDMLKVNVRKLAKEKGLFVHDKPDSTGICFIGDVNIQDFLKERLKPKKGSVILQDGQIIGTHNGAWFYTIGQRHGFEITKYVGIPLYVVAKNIEKNELVVGPIKQAFKSSFLVENLHWICSVPKFPMEAKVRVRNLGEFYDATIDLVAENSVEVFSQKEIFGVAPGQSAVFYKESQVLGGGIIK